MKKFGSVFLIVFLFVFGYVEMSAAADVVTVNDLKYSASIASAGVFPVEYMRIPFGAGEEQVGCYQQDPENYTEGFPFGILPLKDGSVWILDTINQKCKRFSPQGKMLSMVSFKELHPERMGVVRDFAPDGADGFCFACTTDRKIERVDKNGKLLLETEGFPGLWEVAADGKGNFFVNDFSLNSIMRFNPKGELIEKFGGNLNVSIFADSAGNPYGLKTEGDTLILFKMVRSPSEKEIKIAGIPLEPPAVKNIYFAPKKILGTDSSGNVYIETVILDSQGFIHRNRISKISPAGKILSQTEIKPKSEMAIEIPRPLVVTPDGKLMGFHGGEKDFILSTYYLP